MLPSGRNNAIKRNGRAGGSLPRILPRIEPTNSAPSNESLIDISLLDVMGIEEWLFLLKGKTENNSIDLWKETCILALQLKASRELLSIGSNLFSNKSSRKILDRLIEAAYVILGAERVYLLEIEQTGKELVVTHTREENSNGLRIPITQGVEGDVVAKRICANVPDVTKDPRHVKTLELKSTGPRTRCLICAPIIIDGMVIGVVEAVNKIIRGMPRGPEEDLSDLSFSANDCLLLSFIATNAGLALKQSSLRQSIPNIFPVSFDPVVMPRTVSAVDADAVLQRLVENVYKSLEAERISIFTYNAPNHVLICAVSKDIQGTVIPADKGFAGMALTSLRTINVADAKQDTRHNKDVDHKVGFQTRSLLCAPIVGSDGLPLGVIQAVNKIGGPQFTPADEDHIRNVCASLWAVIKEKLLLANGSAESKDQGSRVATQPRAVTPPVVRAAAIPDATLQIAVPSEQEAGGLREDAVNLARSVASMLLSGSLEELVLETERVVRSFTQCDFAGVYALDGTALYRIKQQLQSGTVTASASIRSGCNSPFEPGSPSLRSSHSKHGGLHRDKSRELHFDFLTMGDIPMQVKNALQFKHITEYKLPPEQKQPGYVLPDLRAYQAMIFPMTGKAYSYEPGACTLIVASTKRDRPFTDADKETLEVIADHFNRALHSLHDRLTHEESMRTLRGNFNLVNNTLGVLKDYVILLNAEGNLVACNKHLEDLFGRPAGIAASRDAASSEFEGQHFDKWLTLSNSPELRRDVESALKQGTSHTQEVVKFISPVYAEGVYMDYQVVYIENPDLSHTGSCSSASSSEKAENAVLLTPRGGSCSGDQRPLASRSADELDSNSTFAVVIIVQIHSEKVSRNQSGGFLSHVSIPNVSLANHDTNSAHGVVDAATSIINTLRSSFNLDAGTDQSLRAATTILSDASRHLSMTLATQSAVSRALMEVHCPLVHPSVTLPANLYEWEFDVMEIADGLLLCSVIGQLFTDMFNLEELGVDSSILARFIIEVGKNYHDRPFHNLQHATCVTHFAFMLLRATNAQDHLKPHQLFSILVSAVVHDVDHPGNTNLFEINSSSELALRYNDQSVLENHHCSTAFRLMRKENTQILSGMAKPVAVEVRKLIIACVMATDMAVHFELIDETKKRAAEGWNFSEAKDQSLLGKVLLHAADLSNPVRPFHMTRQWAERISMEFNDQVTREQALGMPVLGFMMTPDEKAFCKNETGFASFVVAPMWRAIAMCYPNLGFLVAQLDSNLLTWKATLEKLQYEEQERAAAAAAAAEAEAQTQAKVQPADDANDGSTEQS